MSKNILTTKNSKITKRENFTQRKTEIKEGEIQETLKITI